MKPESQSQIKVLFVCMGNICRSPTADAVFRHTVKKANLEHAFSVDSAGTHAYHVGNPPDRRAQGAAMRRGYQMNDLRARKVHPDDFAKFDYILAMDHENLSILQQRCPDRFSHKLELMMHYSKGVYSNHEVPDPYFGGDQGFETVLDMIEEASLGLLEHVCNYKAHG
ncbi:protein tyrosine phosphatase [Nitrosomonas marina]|uniref:protein-tyrosine-phosphatase n=1 Tax=Nitrosomonas marina TaxID=917 RepID=A0A1I0CKZ5_9PROT|nr:low molecular weight protein-tyrosine-phosphatase [Nitrosomonas marina]SET20241.1 protein tyrosine phosphatase [Nitrosomonas marina]